MSSRRPPHLRGPDGPPDRFRFPGIDRRRAGAGSKAGHPAGWTGPSEPRRGLPRGITAAAPLGMAGTEPNGASAAIRRLVDEARKRDPEGERAREAATASSRFMSAIAGNMPGFEEASRALFAHDGARFADLISAWPGDIRAQLQRMAGPWFESKSGSTPAT